MERYLRQVIGLSLLLLALSSRGQECHRGWQSAQLEVTDMLVPAGLAGNWLYDIPLSSPQDALYRILRDTQQAPFFSESLWVATKDSNGNIGGGYGVNFFYKTAPYFANGPLDNQGEVYLGCEDWDRVFTVSREEVHYAQSLFRQYGQSIPLSLLPASIREWPAAGNPFFFDRKGRNVVLDSTIPLAPFHDIDGDNHYNPTKGDLPAIRGEHTAWWTYHLQYPANRLVKLSPVDIQINATTYAVEPIDDSILVSFHELEVIPRTTSVDSLVVGLLLDVEIGRDYFDDYLGFDTVEHLGFVYHKPGWEDYYQSYPPWAGLQGLRTTLGPDTLSKPFGLFRFVVNGFVYSITELQRGIDLWRIMTGYYKDGTPMGATGPSGQAVNYQFPGNPGDTTNQVAACRRYPGGLDARMIVATPVVSTVQNEPLRVQYAKVWKRCPVKNICADFTCFQHAAQQVRQYFNGPLSWAVNTPPVSDIQSQGVQVFPNPARQSITIELPSPVQSAQIQVVNAMGQVVRQFTQTTTRQQFQVSDLPNGWYVISYQSNDYPLGRQKLLIQR